MFEAVVDWYRENARDLPWRRTGTSAWAVLVSEFMLQQTPVVRVLPVWEAWMNRWPTAAALAQQPEAEAVRAWGRLGYPRRALRLHACAVTIDRDHDGDVPSTLDELRALPGVGDYTARAVLAFAYRQRAAAVDVNVRRVLARAIHGVADAGPATTRADFAAMETLLPASAERAAHMSAAVMELGAVVCTGRSPSCASCPLSSQCAWRASGYPAYAGIPRRRQAYEGTDRQARGRLLRVLRERVGAVHVDDLREVWSKPEQRERALASLLADGLVVQISESRFALPGDT